jgi:class 3 adenylate cyclase/tetratricopeptide (TPR) repeat protein
VAAPVASPSDVSLQPLVSERKQVTALFADFSGFTIFSRKRDAEDVRDHMVALWEKLDSLIIGHGGTIEKHIGDAIMAVFGAKHSRENDPEQAVRTALAIQTCLTEPLAGGARPQMEMRIGIHTGLVVVGPLGSTGEFAPTGEAINLAKRLEENAPVGGVLISHETYRQVFGIFNVQEMPPLTIRNHPDPFQTYLVLSARTRSLARTLRGVEGLTTPMIGREAELKRLQSALQSVIEERELQMVTVVGEAGIGKSCLLTAFQKWVEQLPESVRLFCGRASVEMAGLPFSLIRDVFFSRFELQESDSVAVAREKFERGITELLGNANDSLLQAHFIGQLLGLDFSHSPYLRDLLKDPEQIRHRAFHYLSGFFSAISRGSAGAAAPSPTRAVLLVVEDLHWSDDGSLDLLDHLVRTCQGAPVMILCLARSSLFERRPSWGEGWAGHTRLGLEALSRHDSRKLVETILRKAFEIPQALRELIVGGAEGIPFYIEEIIKMLIDQKVILPGVEQWRIEPERLASAHVPATLTGILQARLDGLTPRERGILQRASVVGRVFWDIAVERLAASAPWDGAGPPAEATMTKREILEALAGLRRKELIFQRESSAFAGAVEYTFKHELLRSVTYESLLKKSRREHHAQVAAWLIEHSGERIGEFTGLVAAHFEQAGFAAEAAEWYGRAGQQALASNAHLTAIETFRKALQMLPTGSAGEDPVQSRRLEWHAGLGAALGSQARINEAKEAYAAMGVVAEALKDFVAQARAFNGLAYLEERRGDNRASIEAAERASILAQQAGEDGRSEQIQALHLKGWGFYRLGDAPAVLGLAKETLNLCTQLQDRRGMAKSLKLYGVAHLQLGHFLEADSYFQQALALCTESGDRRNAAAMWSNLGESARLRGNFADATELYQKAIAMSREIGHRDSEVIYLSNLAGTRLGLGQFEQAEAELRQVIALTGSPNWCNLSETFSFLSEACLGQKKLSEALSTAEHALELAKKSESFLDLGGAWRALGRSVTALQQRANKDAPGGLNSGEPLPEPDACFSESLRVFNKMNAEGEQARTLVAWAAFELQQGRADEARNKSELARDIFLRLGMTSEAERAQLLI